MTDQTEKQPLTDKEKLKLFLRQIGYKANALHTILGLSNNFLNSGDTIGVDKLRIIKGNAAFSRLSLNWFVMNKGLMLDAREETHGTLEIQEYLYEKELALIKLKEKLTKKGVSDQSDHKDDSTESVEGLVQLAGEVLGTLQQIAEKHQAMFEYMRREFGINSTDR